MAWKSDKTNPATGKARRNPQKGVYWRAGSTGTVAWGYCAAGMNGVRSLPAPSTREQAVVAYEDATRRHRGGSKALDTSLRLSALAEALREAKRVSMRPRAFADWEKALQRVLDRFGHRRPATIGADEVAEFRRELSEGRSQATVVKYEGPFRELLTLAVRRGAISVNPYALLLSTERGQGTKARAPRRWTATELQDVLTVSVLLDQEPTARQAYAPLVHFLIYTGTRIGEALALRWGQVDLLSETVTINCSLNRDGTLGETKTDAGVRVVPIADALLRVLVALKPDEATDEHYVFASHEGTPLNYWNARDRGVKPALRAAGIHDARVHDLRHAVVSLLCAAGLSPVEVAGLVGHADATVTLKTYASWFGSAEAVHSKARAAFDVLSTTQEVAS